VRPLLKKYDCMRGVLHMEMREGSSMDTFLKKVEAPDPLTETLHLSADYHYDPDFIEWMVARRVSQYLDVNTTTKSL